MKLNTRTLFVSLVITAVLGAIITLLQIWFSAFEWIVYGKLMATLGIVGVLSSFLMAIDYDLGSTSSKSYLYALVILSSGAGALTIAQIWLHLLPWWGFKNLLITLLVLAALVGFILVAKDDFTKNKKMRDENYID